jgi:predicted ATPase/class 3 adenylate cyclase
VAGEQLRVPSGTVTFLFSDVVGSTRLWAADSDAMSAALRIHEQILNESIAKFHGYIFSTAGDSFAAAFARASAAVDCAEVIQRSLAEVDWGTWPVLSVRIGLHQGEAEERDDNYFGPVVNQTARVMAVAHGGQTLLTDGVRDAARAAVTDLGIHTLRDSEQPVHLSQLGETEFAPLSSLGQSIASLPLPRTSLVGRDESVEEVRRLVSSHRLVTLTGVGGCGKTRLAIEVAHREVPSYPEGVWFADLSTIADGVALPGAVASALGVMITTGLQPIDQITTYLAPREALLVIDNCEHVIDPSAELVDILLERCPHVRIIATSRESLEVEGEYTWKVPSLAVGDQAPAVRLFKERAAAAGGVLLDDPATASAIVEVVERLDGIPLAIELAAARTRAMSVEEIRGLLDDRFSLLSGGVRRSRQRQATLEGAVQWSYDLLSADEQSILRTLSVFQGGFSVADVATVAQRSESETRQLVDALTNKSLVDVTRDVAGQVRHRLLETIRLFALARLVDAGEAVTTRDRHLDHFSNEGIPLSLSNLFKSDRLVREGREYENFRSATVWAIERDRSDAAVRMAALGIEAAINRGEAQLALDVLRLPADLSPNDKRHAAAATTWLLVTQGNIVGALAAVEKARSLDDEAVGHQRLFLLYCEFMIQSVLGDVRRSRSVIDAAQRLALDSGDSLLIAGCDLFINTWYQNVLLFDESIEVCRSTLVSAPDFAYRHVVEYSLAWSLLATGQRDEAAEVVDAFTAIPPGSQWGHGSNIVAHLVLAHRDGPEAAGRSLGLVAREAVSRRPQIGGDFLTGFAYFHHMSGATERARFINENTLTVTLASAQRFMQFADRRVAGDDVIELIDASVEELPAIERYRRSAEFGPHLLAEELERWS